MGRPRRTSGALLSFRDRLILQSIKLAVLTSNPDPFSRNFKISSAFDFMHICLDRFNLAKESLIPRSLLTNFD
jgi:hypothetical protein